MGTIILKRTNKRFSIDILFRQVQTNVFKNLDIFKWKTREQVGETWFKHFEDVLKKNKLTISWMEKKKDDNESFELWFEIKEEMKNPTLLHKVAEETIKSIDFEEVLNWNHIWLDLGDVWEEEEDEVKNRFEEKWNYLTQTIEELVNYYNRKLEDNSNFLITAWKEFVNSCFVERVDVENINGKVGSDEIYFRNNQTGDNAVEISMLLATILGLKKQIKESHFGLPYKTTIDTFLEAWKNSNGYENNMIHSLNRIIILFHIKNLGKLENQSDNWTEIIRLLSWFARNMVSKYSRTQSMEKSIYINNLFKNCEKREYLMYLFQWELTLISEELAKNGVIDESSKFLKEDLHIHKQIKFFEENNQGKEWTDEFIDGVRKIYQYEISRTLDRVKNNGSWWLEANFWVKDWFEEIWNKNYKEKYGFLAFIYRPVK